MSTYAQVSDVRALAPQIGISASTKPSEGDTQTFLNTVESELNAILTNLGYSTPVAASATESRIILKDLAAQGALAKVLRARAFGADASLLDAAKVAESAYRGTLKALNSSSDPFVLPDATTTSLAVSKTPDARGDSFANEEFDDIDEDNPRVTRAQVW